MAYKTEQEAIDGVKAITVDMYGWTDFDGNNCDDYLEEGEVCLGWDGEHKRCFCGNRRVSWTTVQHTDGTWSAYAEAY